jgi:hypothetical protein
MSPSQNLEINARHHLILRLATARSSQPTLAASVAKQLLDNALVAAGLMDDPRAMIGNMTQIMAEALKPHAPHAPDTPDAPPTEAPATPAGATQAGAAGTSQGAGATQADVGRAAASEGQPGK